MKNFRMRLYFIFNFIFLFYYSFGQVNTIENENSSNSANIIGSNNTIVNNYSLNAGEKPNLEATLIIDNVWDSTFSYHYKIENQGNSTIRNITYSISSNDFFEKENEAFIARQLDPNNILKCDVLDRPNFLKIDNFSFYLIIKFTDYQDRHKHCLFEFQCTKDDIKASTEIFKNSKNEDKTEDEEQQYLLNNSKLDTPPEVLLNNIYKYLYVKESYKLAYDYINKGIYDSSIYYFKKINEIHPSDTIYYNIGVSYLYLGQTDSALCNFTNAVIINTQYSAAYRARGITYELKGLHYDALKDYTKVIELNPRKAEAYYDRGIIYFEMNLFNGAILDFSKAINLNSKFDSAYFNRGLAYYQEDLFNEAIMDYSQAIALNPFKYEAYYNRALAFDKKEIFGESLKDYSIVIEFNPLYTNAYINRGLNYLKLNELDRGREDFSKAIATNPQFYGAYFNMGNLYYVKSVYDSAIIYYSKSIELSPGHSNIYFNRGLGYDKKGEYDKAIKDYTEAISLYSKFADAYANRGWDLYNKFLMNSSLNDFNQDTAKKILCDFNKAIELDSLNSIYYYNRGRIYWQLAQSTDNSKNDANNAMKDFIKAEKLCKEAGADECVLKANKFVLRIQATYKNM